MRSRARAQAVERPPVELADQPAPQDASHTRAIWLGILGTVAGVFALHAAQEFLIPLALAIFLTYALEPITAQLVRVGLPRAGAAALLLLGVVGCVSLGIYTLTDDAVEVARRLPVAAREFRQSLQRYGKSGAFDQAQQIATEIEKSAAAAAAPPPPPQDVMRVQIEEKPIDVRGWLWRGSMNAAGMVTDVILFLFLTYFLMASGDLFKRKLVKIAGPSLSQKRVTIEVLDEISWQVQRFLVIQLVTSTAVGIVSWAAFSWYGLEQPAVWGVAAGVLNTIPYFGPIVVSGALGIAGFLQFGELTAAAGLVGIALLITGLEGFLITPLLIGRATRMNEVVVFVSLMFWGWLWGPLGMLIAVPIMMVIKATCDRVEALASVGELLGD